MNQEQKGQKQSNLLDSEFLHKLEKLAILNKKMKRGVNTGKRKSKNQGTSIEFADYRSYTPGDDFRQIDWNAYARTEKLFLKTFLDEQELHISIYVDTSKSMGFGAPSKLETSLKIAAALGYISLHHFDRVSLYGFDSRVHNRLPSLMGKAKSHQLFKFLNELEVKEEGDLNQALATGLAVTGKPGISIIISDFLYDDGYEKGVSFVQAANQEVILVHVLAEEERDPFLDGDIRLIDSESRAGKEISITPYLLEEYHRTLEIFKKEISDFAFKRGMSYLNVNAEMKIEEIIFHVFKRVGLIR